MKGFSYSFNLSLSHTQNNPSEVLYSFFTTHQLNGSDVIGMVGPRDNEVAEHVAYIFGARITVQCLNSTDIQHSRFN